MKKDDLTYAGLQRLVARYVIVGQTESRGFVHWFLDNIYRLDDVEAADAICDDHNDKGIDGIYVDNSAQEIHVLQSKVRQKDGSTLGDTDLKQFSGTIGQLSSSESIDIILAGNANPDLKRILVRQNIRQLVVDGYRVVGVFITNQDRDHNCVEYLKHVDNLRVYDRERITSDYIDFNADEGVRDTFSFDVSYAGSLELQGDNGIVIFMFPALATELVNLKGITDTTLFKQNVRLSLGNTAVNKAIAKSISDKKEHRNFPLYHNGITVLCGAAIHNIDTNKIEITDYVVVNGAQSISTFYKNAGKLSDDLRVFVKVIALRDEDLARKITLNSNNQNAIKPRDLRSNHNIMLRLKAEFDKSFPNYHFEIKRGEPLVAGKTTITNELAGRLLLAFDLDQPYASHQIYKVFDENYSEIFGRPEVNAARIVFLYELFQIVSAGLADLKHKQMGGYALTRFFVLNVLRHMMKNSKTTDAIISSRDELFKAETRDYILEKSSAVLGDLIIDFDYEINEEGDALDYKSHLKSPDRVKAWRNKLLSTYEKELKKKKAVSFD